jgi:Na+-transporting NADH:ubiquinone oxidoreductase subunit A
MMAELIKIKRGLDIKLQGKAEEIHLSESIHPSSYALIPDDFHGIPPKLAVKEGDVVKAGSVLFTDKYRPEIRIVSPVSGTISAIVRGEKRKLLRIEIKADFTNEYEDFGVKKVQDLSGTEIKKHLTEAGIWPFIKQRPYDIIANPTDTPRDIFVSGFDSAPLAPNIDFILQGQEDDFQTGLDALSKLTSGNVYLGVSPKTLSPALLQAKNVKIKQFKGPHPAGNTGVQIRYVSPINKGDVVWVIRPADILFIGRLFNKGIADFKRTIALTGSEVLQRGYVNILPGASLEGAIKVTTSKHLRYISGNVLTGKKIDANGFLGAYDNQITVIPEGDEKSELFGWISPGFTKYSVNHSFLTWLITAVNKKKEYVIDARVKGGERAIIMSNEYDKVFPGDILPEFLIKAIIAFDIDKMENLGIYEVAPEDFALCEFVDTSKLEIQRIVREGLDKLKQEMS